MAKILNQNKEKIRIIISMLIWGTVGVFVRKVNLESVEVAFFRALIGSIFLFILGFFKKEKVTGSKLKRNFFILVLSGAIIGFNWVLLFQAYKYTTIANATLSYYTAPIFISIFSYIILKEKLSIKKIIYILISMLGLFLIIQAGGTSSGTSYNHLKGILYGLSGAVLYGTVIILNKYIKGIPGFTMTLIQLFVAAMVLLPLVIGNDKFSLALVDKGSWLILLFIGIVHTGFTYLIFFSAMKEVEGQSIAILSYIDPIFAVLVSFVFLNEPMGLVQIIGGILILTSTYLSERN